jgi:hemophore-related protein
MKMSATTVRRGVYGAFAACALGAGAAIAMPTANAAPPCSASAFSSTASGVLASAGAYLDTHPAANDVLTNAGVQGPGSEASVRDYFVANPQELQELRGIAQPLINMQKQCNASIQPMQIAALYTALASMDSM